MNLKLYNNDMLEESRKYGGKSPWLECLMLLGVFLGVQLVTMLFALPINLTAVMFLNTFQQYSAAHGQEALLSLVSNISMSISLVLQAVTIAAVILFCKWSQKRKVWTLGFRKSGWFREYLVGALVGFLMFTLVFLLSVLTGSVTLRFNEEVLKPQSLIFLILFFAGFLIQGMSEEVLFRGYFLISLGRKKNNLWMAVIVSALLFAAAHLLNNGISLMAFLNLTLFGIFAGVYFLKRGNIWGIGAMHALWNFTQGNIWGVSVSGMDMGPSLFKSVSNADLSFLNGGSFGLEGSIFATAVLAAGILVLLKLHQEGSLPDLEEVIDPSGK